MNDINQNKEKGDSYEFSITRVDRNKKIILVSLKLSQVKSMFFILTNINRL